MCFTGYERTFKCYCSYLEEEKQVNEHWEHLKNGYPRNMNMAKRDKELRKKKADEDIVL